MWFGECTRCFVVAIIVRGRSEKDCMANRMIVILCVCAFVHFLKRFSKVIKHAITSYKKCDKHGPQCPVNIVFNPVTQIVNCK